MCLAGAGEPCIPTSDGDCLAVVMTPPFLMEERLPQQRQPQTTLQLEPHLCPLSTRPWQPRTLPCDSPALVADQLPVPDSQVEGICDKVCHAPTDEARPTACQPLQTLTPATNSISNAAYHPATAAHTQPKSPQPLLTQPPTPADAGQMLSSDSSGASSPWLTYVPSVLKKAAAAPGGAPHDMNVTSGNEGGFDGELSTCPTPLVPQFAAAEQVSFPMGIFFCREARFLL